MNGSTRRVSTQRRTPLLARWSLRRAGGEWVAITGPDTVAAALRAIGQWSLDAPTQRFDADDWWFRAEFEAPASAAPTAHRALAFGGLAGPCEVWLNGAALLQSSNMHLHHTCDEPTLAPTGNELLLRFASLDRWLAHKRPRPRWRAPMVEHQQLRWARTTLLGRTTGWSPPAAAVGPWRAVEWVERERVDVSRLRLRSGVDGTSGMLAISVDLTAFDEASPVAQVDLVLARAGQTHRVELSRADATATGFAASLNVPDVALWWPHTHGEPALYEGQLLVRTANVREPVTVDLGRIGFRSLTLDTAHGDFALRVNGVAVFCRGACWTPLDVVSLKATPEACRTALEKVRDAGMNMLRVSGTMVYEDDAFFDACDALGILVWQDFMFANMDYPNDDAAFAASVRDEAAQQLERWQARPCLAVLCGNSEAEQQAAMWGAPREAWSQPLFDRDLAELAHAWCPDVPYWPSSAHGGAFPHQNNAGTTSYYGVGAYLRPLDDARRSGLRFATECLAFANVPPPATLARMPGGTALRVTHAGWKARAPRDLGAGWDFDDVRDHYLQRLYGVDALALRSTDHAHYLALSRAVGAEVMAAAFGEWRRAGSGCRGALVWFLRDLWAGAGWGLLDDVGAPKAAFHGCRRALAPIAAFISEEGTNGLDLHLVNDPGRALAARIEVALYRDDGLRVGHAEQTHTVAAHGALTLPLAQWFDHFIDLSRAYRFGPAEHALVVATVCDAGNAQVAQAFAFPDHLPARRERDIGLSARAERLADGSVDLTLTTRGFAQSVHFDVPGFIARDEYFHLAPGAARRVCLSPVAVDTRGGGRGQVHALNSLASVTLELPPC